MAFLCILSGKTFFFGVFFFRLEAYFVRKIMQNVLFALLFSEKEFILRRFWGIQLLEKNKKNIK